ncbi:ATP-dependent RNA helicase [Aureococcus anophagefferens]|nr:ATP-dependent RNA helicase [Aureococcus anophagefferens]
MATVLPPPVEFRFTKRERDLVDAYLAAHGAEADDAATAPGAAAAPPPAPNGDWVRGELAKLRAAGAAATPAAASVPAPRALVAACAAPVAVVRGATGCGKSTQLPRLVEAAADGGAAAVRVVVCEPRRLGATALARRVAAEWAGGGDGDGAALGGLVGYAVRGESRRRGETPLEYVTTGALLRRLQEPGALARYTHVVVDEVHERSSDVDLLLLVLKRAVGRGAAPRVVLMSATVDVGPLRAYFGGAAALDVPGRTFPVDVRYVEDAAGGAMLVFVPGVAEIDDVAARLAAAPALVVALLHGRLSPAEQRAAFRPAPRGKTKVVVATDVAEASITLPDVTVVVDCGFARGVASTRARRCAVATTRVPADSAAQRAGRAGRVRAGACWRLWTRAEHAQLAARAPRPRRRQPPVAAEIDGDRPRGERALDALVASVPLRGGAAVRFRKHFLEKPAGRGGGKGGRGRGGRGKGRGKGDAPPKPPPKKAPPKKKKDDGALLAATLAEGKGKKR